MLTYKDAGVDIEAGERMVDRIKPLVRSTFTPGVLADIGAFGGFFRPELAGMEDPVLVSSVDGVGTKLKVAFRMDKHDTVGQDLVNHCVNDIAVCGARPLFFLDYFSTGKLEEGIAEQLISGFAIACRENGCALIGGETAEMPDLYSPGEYDLAGTIVGIVDKTKIYDGSRVEEGDVLIGIPSSGLHTNGYSLARKVLFGTWDIHDRPEELEGVSIGESLLTVHRSYLELIQALSKEDLANAFSHITGGGIEGNTRRVIPKGMHLDVSWDAWHRPNIFTLIQRTGDVPEEDMRRTFNLGIGLVAIVSEKDTARAMAFIRESGERPVVIGKVRANPVDAKESFR